MEYLIEVKEVAVGHNGVGYKRLDHLFMNIIKINNR